MAKSRKSLSVPRSLAFSNQSGRCFYCNEPMWAENPHEFALKHKITLGQAKHFQCTGEHLKAHKDGGTADQNNIVAACWFCNQKRHKRKTPLPPDQYKQLIDRRMTQGRWHDVRLN
jgi:5-methylcytosine-specific restriction endonuclease McrA